MELFGEITRAYRDFASYAAGESPTFEEWALRVSEDAEAIAWIAALPPIKQQPNLVFAAARWHGVPAPGGYAALRSALLGDDGSLRHTILTRATQTNEAGRLATLTPVFGMIPGPLALVEVGASAGLCLYPDAWGYVWHASSGDVVLGDEPRLEASVTGGVPLPAAMPEIAWRAGIDLHPLDVRDRDAMAWLENLVWPEQDARRATLRHGIALARANPPMLVAGDLFDRLHDTIAAAAMHGTVVVFHSAVIAYLTPDDRARFDRLMRGLVAEGVCRWISNEAPAVLPSIAGARAVAPARFVLGLDGGRIGTTHGHGAALDWER